MNIVIVGAGYVGLITAVCLANSNRHITCVDIDEQRINMLQNGIAPIHEAGLEDLLEKTKLFITYTCDNKNAYKNADVIIVCVDTPKNSDGGVDLTNINIVLDDISKNIENDCVIVMKSTVPVGACDKLEKELRDRVGKKIEFVSNPEFLSQGTAIRSFLQAERIVLGVHSKSAEQKMKEIYDTLGIPYIITNRASAELIKYASNNFLALKLSYINEMANLCEIMGANIDDVVKGIGADSRIGNQFTDAGIGYGGSCLPKDTEALHFLATTNGYELKTIKAAIDVNTNQKQALLKKAKKYYASFEGLTIAILGLSFKPNTDDIREAPSLSNIPVMLNEGAKIKVFDPIAQKNVEKRYLSELKYCESITQTLENADICFIFTEWDFVKNMDLSLFQDVMKTPIILDGRNCFDLEEMRRYRVIYESVGRAVINRLVL